MIAFGVARSGGRAAARWSAQLAALSIVILVGIVLPGAAIYFPGGVDDLVQGAYFDNTHPDGRTSTSRSFGRALQLVFMSAASLLPALLYFLFDRQQLRTLREQFERHMFRLDPSVDTLADVRAKYGTLLGETYGTTTGRGQGRLLPGRRSPVMIATVVITFGWLVTLLNQDVHVISDRVGVLALFQPQRSALIFGFLGAYFFALQLIQRGYARGDLRPKDVHADHDPDPPGHDPRDGAPGHARGRRRAVHPRARLRRRDRPRDGARRHPGVPEQELGRGGLRTRHRRAGAADEHRGDRPVRPRPAPRRGRLERRGARPLRPDRADAPDAHPRSAPRRLDRPVDPLPARRLERGVERGLARARR